MKNNNGVYLNDIPFNAFMDYYNKLKENDSVNDISKFTTHQNTIRNFLNTIYSESYDLTKLTKPSLIEVSNNEINLYNKKNDEESYYSKNETIGNIKNRPEYYLNSYESIIYNKDINNIYESDTELFNSKDSKEQKYVNVVVQKRKARFFDDRKFETYIKPGNTIDNIKIKFNSEYKIFTLPSTSLNGFYIYDIDNEPYILIAIEFNERIFKIKNFSIDITINGYTKKIPVNIKNMKLYKTKSSSLTFLALRLDIIVEDERRYFGSLELTRSSTSVINNYLVLDNTPLEKIFINKDNYIEQAIKNVLLFNFNNYKFYSTYSEKTFYEYKFSPIAEIPGNEQNNFSYFKNPTFNNYIDYFYKNSDLSVFKQVKTNQFRLAEKWDVIKNNSLENSLISTLKNENVNELKNSSDNVDVYNYCKGFLYMNQNNYNLSDEVIPNTLDLVDPDSLYKIVIKTKTNNSTAKTDTSPSDSENTNTDNRNILDRLFQYKEYPLNYLYKTSETFFQPTNEGVFNNVNIKKSSINMNNLQTTFSSISDFTDLIVNLLFGYSELSEKDNNNLGFLNILNSEYYNLENKLGDAKDIEILESETESLSEKTVYSSKINTLQELVQ